MRNNNIFILSAALFIILSSCKNHKAHQETMAQKDAKTPERIVSLDGTLTEILCALGFQQQIVGVDISSVYPKTVKEKAVDLGHGKDISLEGLMQSKPTEIFSIVSDNQGKYTSMPVEIRNRLKDLNIPVHYYTSSYSIESTKNLIKKVAKDVKSNKADSLINKIDKDAGALIQFKVKPKVMYIYAKGAGTLLAAGKKTPMESLIKLAGGKNIITDYEGYKPITPEAVAKANPDVLLFFKKGLQGLNGIEGLKKIPVLSITTAVKKNQVIAMDTSLLLNAFGPRLGQAIKHLNNELAKYAE